VKAFVTDEPSPCPTALARIGSNADPSTLNSSLFNAIREDSRIVGENIAGSAWRTWLERNLHGTTIAVNMTQTLAFAALGQASMRAGPQTQLRQNSSFSRTTSGSGSSFTNSDGLPINSKITGWTRHGTGQALGRDGGIGVGNNAIIDTVNNPIQIVTQSGGTTKFIGQNATVVLNSDGKVVTTWATNSSGTRGG